jgi:hypothetical protein
MRKRMRVSQFLRTISVFELAKIIHRPHIPDEVADVCPPGAHKTPNGNHQEKL